MQYRKLRIAKSRHSLVHKTQKFFVCRSMEHGINIIGEPLKRRAFIAMGHMRIRRENRTGSRPISHIKTNHGIAREAGILMAKYGPESAHTPGRQVRTSIL